MTLTEFLLARIAEDEARYPLTKWRLAWGDGVPPQHSEAAARMRGRAPGSWQEFLSEDSARTMQARSRKPSRLTEVPRDGASGALARRIRAECVAKRRIIERCRAVIDWRVADDFAANNLADDVLRTLALPYVNHPHYRAEWQLTALR